MEVVVGEEGGGRGGGLNLCVPVLLSCKLERG